VEVLVVVVQIHVVTEVLVVQVVELMQEVLEEAQLLVKEMQEEVLVVLVLEEIWEQVEVEPVQSDKMQVLPQEQQVMVEQV
jgi:hypothetical protein